MRTVFVLGAGLSHAISDAMPLTDELGNLVRARVPEAAARSPRGFKGGYFEAWLSRLAEAQPDLLDHENATNYGLFLRVLHEIHGIIRERELEVLKGEPSWWLRRLVGLMHAGAADVITFNYDTLIEHTVAHSLLATWPSSSPAEGFQLARGVPPLHAAASRRASGGSFRLLKLHGSLDTFWVPGDSSGATIQRWHLLGGWGNAREAPEEARRRDLPGRSPFIVPPAAAKSSFYNNPVTRELWRSAGEALRGAGRVALIGYSMPPTDLVTSGMLTDALAGRDVAVDVVNPRPEPIVDRLADLGVERGRIKASLVEDFTDELETSAAETVASKLAGTKPDRSLVVATSSVAAARVTGVRRTGDIVRLEIEPVDSLWATTSLDRHRPRTHVTIATLLEDLDPGTRIAEIGRAHV